MSARLGLPVRRVEVHPAYEPPAPGVWPGSIPAVRHVVEHGLDLDWLTILVGENGSGKSTLLEAIAMAYGMAPEGGAVGSRHSTRSSESELYECLRLDRSPGRQRRGYFVRGDTMHGLFTYLDENPRLDPEPRFHTMSHGQSFMSLLEDRTRIPGFLILDEPESGLSFTTLLGLMGSLAELVAGGTQVLLATHSPVLAALPGARVVQLDEDGLRDTTWDELDTVAHHRMFLDAPGRYLRHLLQDDAPAGKGINDPRTVRRVERDPDSSASLDPNTWPATIPAVEQVLTFGLDLGQVTVLVGENASGKSTLTEAIATRFGLNPEGGSTHGNFSTAATESPLHRVLRLVRSAGASPWGFFVRSETVHNLFTYMEALASRDPRFHEMSHGEAFTTLLRDSRFDGPGFYVLDEPEDGLSFQALLGTLANLDAIRAARGQVLLATHSPVLAALPGALVVELDDDGFHQTTWDDLATVAHHRSFLADPTRYLRHLLPDA